MGHIRVGRNDYKIEPKTQEATLISKVKHVIYKADRNQGKDRDFKGDTKTFTVGKCTDKSTATCTKYLQIR